jgi:hypothetical protein
MAQIINMLYNKTKSNNVFFGTKPTNHPGYPWNPWFRSVFASLSFRFSFQNQIDFFQAICETLLGCPQWGRKNILARQGSVLTVAE